MLTEQDHARLREAASLVKDVADRHPSGDLRAISALCAALQEIRLAERYAAVQPTDWYPAARIS